MICFGKAARNIIAGIAILTASQAWGIGFVNPDDMYDPPGLVNGTPYIPIPSDLPYPTNVQVVRITDDPTAGGTRGTATMLDGGWLITHDHYDGADHSDLQHALAPGQACTSVACNTK